MTNAVNLSALGSNGSASLPNWTTGTRPSSPITGQSGFNSTLGSFEFYNGSSWISINSNYITYTATYLVIAGEIGRAHV